MKEHTLKERRLKGAGSCCESAQISQEDLFKSDTSVDYELFHVNKFSSVSYKNCA